VSDALRAALRAQGGLLAELAERPEPDRVKRGDAPSPPQLAASGPRTAGHEAEYELLIEMIAEGSRLHYEASAVEPDVALLLGDQLYALGLERLAALGDLEAVAALGDVISAVAQAHAEGRAELADAAWADGARRIGWGSPQAQGS
jgi:hypothetical protein